MKDLAMAYAMKRKSSMKGCSRCYAKGGLCMAHGGEVEENPKDEFLSWEDDSSEHQVMDDDEFLSGPEVTEEDDPALKRKQMLSKILSKRRSM